QRKRVLDYDNVSNRQRALMYSLRNELLASRNVDVSGARTDREKNQLRADALGAVIKELAVRAMNLEALNEISAPLVFQDIPGDIEYEGNGYTSPFPKRWKLGDFLNTRVIPEQAQITPQRSRR